MMESKRIDLEARKMMLEHEAGERRTNAVFNALTPMSALFASPIDKKMRTLGRQTTSKGVQPQPPQGNPVGPVAEVEPPNKMTIQIKCGCGHRENLIVEGAPPEKLNCPACEQELIVQSPETPESAPSPEPEKQTKEEGSYYVKINPEFDYQRQH